MTVTLDFLEAPGAHENVVLPSSIGGAAHEHPEFSGGILDIESILCLSRFSDDRKITKSRYHQFSFGFHFAVNALPSWSIEIRH
jgi:hypothetical protein